MKITALSYNISWANQKNIAAGSEKDFVEMCQKKKIRCFNNSLKIIRGIDNLHLIGLQEVNTDNLEKTLIKSNKHLNSYTRGAVGLSSVSLIWNSKIFGKLKNKRVINLKEGDQRPCLIIETVKGYQLIAAHFPWIDYKRQLNKVYDLIRLNCFSKSMPTIVLADTNDEYTLISKESPFKIGSYKLSQGLTKAKLKKELISCCWHKKGHKLNSFVATGDYILAPASMMVKNYIPDSYKNILASDHRPVLADLNIKK